MTCGIYKLSFKGTDKVYIGQSVNIEYRYSTHLRYLRNGRASKKLTDAYHKYGKPILEILCECATNELDTFENEAIAIFNSVENGFNTLNEAGDTPNSKEFNSGNSKYTEEDIFSVAYLLQNPLNTITYIEQQTGVNSRTVTEVSNLTMYSDWLSTNFPEMYSIILDLKGARRKIHSIASAERRSYTMSAEAKGIHYPPIKSPDGIVYNVKNTSKFAKEHGLHNGHLVALLNGKAQSHKGWKVCQEEHQ